MKNEKRNSRTKSILFETDIQETFFKNLLEKRLVNLLFDHKKEIEEIFEKLQTYYFQSFLRH